MDLPIGAQKRGIQSNVESLSLSGLINIRFVCIDLNITRLGVLLVPKDRHKALKILHNQ